MLEILRRRTGESLPCVLGFATAQAVRGTNQNRIESNNPTLHRNIVFGFETSFC